MRRLLIPSFTLLCLCCATLPRQTRTDVQVYGGLARSQWTEPGTSCGGFPPAVQLDNLAQVGGAIEHHHEIGLDLGVAVEAQHETVTSSRNHPSPPDGAQDWLIAGGAYVGATQKYVAMRVGGSVWKDLAVPYVSISSGNMDKVWGNLQIGRWRPNTDTRLASVGLGFRPVPQVTVAPWFGIVSSVLWIYPVNGRSAGGDTHWGDVQPAPGITIDAKVNAAISLFVQAVAAPLPSGFVGIGFSPEALLHADDAAE